MKRSNNSLNESDEPTRVSSLADEESLSVLLYADGGEDHVSNLFGERSEIKETRWDRYKRLYSIYVIAPARVLLTDWRAVVGFSIIIFYFIMGILGPLFVEPAKPMDSEPLLQPFVVLEYPLGTDKLGRSILSEVIYSTMPILKMMAAGGVFVIIVGTAFGTLSGYKGGSLDTILSTIIDVFINIPGLPLVIVLSVLFEPQNPYAVGVLLSIAAWAGLARAIRSQVLTLRSEPFTEAGRAMGVPVSRILLKDIVPHLAPYIMINFVNSMRRVIFSAVGLYFLGVLPYGDSNWGIMLSQSYSYGAHYRPSALHWLLIPMLVITLLSIGLILVAQSLDRVFNPRVRARHEGERSNLEGENEVEGTKQTATMGQL